MCPLLCVLPTTGATLLFKPALEGAMENSFHNASRKYAVKVQFPTKQQSVFHTLPATLKMWKLLVKLSDPCFNCTFFQFQQSLIRQY